MSIRSHMNTLHPRVNAALAEAEQNVKQLKASSDQVTAQAERADAQVQLAQQNYDRQAQLFKANVVVQATLDTATRNLDVSKQTSQRGQSRRRTREVAYTSNIGGVNTAVAKVRPELADAEFDL